MDNHQDNDHDQDHGHATGTYHAYDSPGDSPDDSPDNSPYRESDSDSRSSNSSSIEFSDNDDDASKASDLALQGAQKPPAKSEEDTLALVPSTTDDQIVHTSSFAVMGGLHRTPERTDEPTLIALGQETQSPPEHSPQVLRRREDLIHEYSRNRMADGALCHPTRSYGELYEDCKVSHLTEDRFVTLIMSREVYEKLPADKKLMTIVPCSNGTKDDSGLYNHLCTVDRHAGEMLDSYILGESVWATVETMAVIDPTPILQPSRKSAFGRSMQTMSNCLPKDDANMPVKPCTSDTYWYRYIKLEQTGEDGEPNTSIVLLATVTGAKVWTGVNLDDEIGHINRPKPTQILTTMCEIDLKDPAEERIIGSNVVIETDQGFMDRIEYEDPILYCALTESMRSADTKQRKVDLRERLTEMVPSKDSKKSANPVMVQKYASTFVDIAAPTVSEEERLFCTITGTLDTQGTKAARPLMGHVAPEDKNWMLDSNRVHIADTLEVISMLNASKKVLQERRQVLSNMSARPVGTGPKKPAWNGLVPTMHAALTPDEDSAVFPLDFEKCTELDILKLRNVTCKIFRIDDTPWMFAFSLDRGPNRAQATDSDLAGTLLTCARLAAEGRLAQSATALDSFDREGEPSVFPEMFSWEYSTSRVVLSMSGQVTGTAPDAILDSPRSKELMADAHYKITGESLPTDGQFSTIDAIDAITRILENDEIPHINAKGLEAYRNWTDMILAEWLRVGRAQRAEVLARCLIAAAAQIKDLSKFLTDMQPVEKVPKLQKSILHAPAHAPLSLALTDGASETARKEKRKRPSQKPQPQPQNWQKFLSGERTKKKSRNDGKTGGKKRSRDRD